MANMKTLTVNGVTYTVDDPDAVTKEQLDSAISGAVPAITSRFDRWNFSAFRRVRAIALSFISTA